MDFNFVRLVATFKLSGDVTDPYALFIPRGSFEKAFKLASGCHKNSCDGCAHGAHCAYSAVFSQILSNDPAALKRHQKPSLPFVFDFPVVPPVPNGGKRLEIGLTLASSAARFARQFVSAFGVLFNRDQLDAIVPATLEKVETEGYFGERTDIDITAENGSLGGLVLLSVEGLLATRTMDGGQLKLAVTTPMKIVQDGKPLGGFAFSPFARAVLRRVSSLAYHYGEGELDADYRELARLAEVINIQNESFHWEEWRGKAKGCRMGGLVGEGGISGDVGELLPHLLLGEYFHVGKGAPFGLGKYKIIGAGP